MSNVSALFEIMKIYESKFICIEYVPGVENALCFRSSILDMTFCISPHAKSTRNL